MSQAKLHYKKMILPLQFTINGDELEKVHRKQLKKRIEAAF